MRTFYSFILVFSFVLNADLIFAQDPYANKTSAFREWLGEPLHTSSRPLTDGHNDFHDLALMVGHLYISDKANGWEVFKVLNYNNWGQRVNPSFHFLTINPFEEKQRVLVGGYYFAKKTFGDKEVRLIIHVGGSSSCSRFLQIYYANSTSEEAQQTMDELTQYTNKKNPYRNNVLHSEEDQWGSTCYTFLENVHDFNHAWEDLILDPKIKSDVYKNTIQLVKNFPQYLKSGKKIKRGALLYGPPGTGKSFVAQVLISQVLKGELKGLSSLIVVTARHLKYSELVGQLFRVSQAVGPTTIFMEDIDLLGIKSRGMQSTDGDARDKEILNEFLNGMDGLVEMDASLFIGTTNQVQNVDPALTRSGRLGLHFSFALPNYFERKEFFKRFGSKKAQLDETVDYEWLAAFTEGFSGADIIESIRLCKQRALVEGSWATENEKLLLKREYFIEAIDKVRNNDVSTYEY